MLDASTVQQVTGILRDDDPRWGLPFRCPTAGESGTTHSNVDAWYVAHAPRWVVTTWVVQTDSASSAEVDMNWVNGNGDGGG